MAQGNSALAPGTPAPAFDLPLLGGGRATRDALVQSGRPALLVFFKTECPTCKLSIPFLERAWRRFRGAGEGAIGFLSIAQNPLGELPEFFRLYGATFPAASESEPYPVSDAFGISNVPTIFTLDEHGVIVRTGVGFSRSELDAAVADLMGRAGVASAASLFTEADSGVPILQPG